jgi:hypothetical protein
VTPEVRAWLVEGLLLEHYVYPSGVVEPLPRHAHAEYQFGLSLDHAGEYRYRGARHMIPAGALSAIQSGEAHTPSDRPVLDHPAQFAMLYVQPAALQTAAPVDAGACTLCSRKIISAWNRTPGCSSCFPCSSNDTRASLPVQINHAIARAYRGRGSISTRM